MTIYNCKKALENKYKYIINEEINRLAIILEIVHILFIGFFIYFKIYYMAVVNVFSVILYIVCRYINKSGRITSCFKLCYWEVLVHLLICNIMIGNKSGFNMFYLSLIACVYVTYYYLEKSRGENFNIHFYAGLSTICFIGNTVLSYYISPVYNKENIIMNNTFMIFNSICSVTVLYFFMHKFLNSALQKERELNKENEILKIESNTDPLTKLHNRREIENYIKYYYDTQKNFSVILCDIDDFKNINDKYGHKCGDVILKEVARIIKSNTYKSGYVCRWGGEEILTLLPEIDGHKAKEIAGKIRLEINNRQFTYKNEIIHVTITTGIAFNNNKTSVDATIEKADANLYKGKSSGKNIVVY